MSYVSTLIGSLSRRKQRAHAQQALARAVEAFEPLEGRQLLSTVSISNPSANEGSPLLYTVSLDAASSSPVTVNYSVGGGTAKAGKDYVKPKNGKVTFAAGETTKTITVNTKDNNTFTADKTVQVKLSKPSKGNKLAGKATGTGTIVNTDTAPSLTINNVRVTEGNKGSKTVTMSVKMNGGSETPLKVSYATQDGTATSTGGKSADYKAAKGTLTFSKNKTQTIKLKVNGDSTPEADEAFLVKLTPAKGFSGVTVVNPLVPDANFAVVSIANDDGSTLSDGTTASVLPGTLPANRGSGAGVTITLNQISADPVTVHYATANGTAVAGSDYTATAGDVTFNPGETQKLVAVPVSSTAADGSTFTVNISNPSGATLATPSSTVTITNVPLPALTISSPTVSEAAGTASFTVSLPAAAAVPVAVHFATADGTATAGSDYTATTGTLNFAAGETSKTITVPIINDTAAEATETFTLSLSQPVNASLGAPSFGTATITDDDSSTVPTDNSGLKFGTNTGLVLDTRSNPTPAAFNYDITSQRSAPVTNLQLQFFLVHSGQDVNTLTPYKTFDLGTINPGQNLSGSVDLTGSPQATLGSGDRYVTQLVANGVVFDTSSSIPF